MNPIEGPGERSLECQNYDACLTTAAKTNWQKFTCEACPEFGASATVIRMVGTKKNSPKNGTVSPAPQEKRICSLCKERPTITPQTPYCPVCMHNLPGKKVKKKDPARRSLAKPAKHTDNTVSVDFGSYGDILEQVRDLAQDQGSADLWQGG